ncbi:antitoxin [Caulobacter sp. FWC2]|uniref:antitoxin n=1 Tax=Caulobacter sp. FWC2 TaxID=69664 RepID=UPI000C146D4B|nr:antitoxin [Caulobacter sp. FWC2]PIB90702.1 antitoxin [Caulobacter sp. FWC2]
MADGFDIHIDNEQAAQLKAGAEKFGMSVSEYALALIEAGLTGAPPRIIDPDPAIDEAIADAVERGDMPSIPLSEFRERLRRFGGRD